jgi:hypothetical protein
MPISMRAVSNVKKNNKRGKKRKMAPGSGSSEQRVAQSKKRNPLYSGDSGAGDADGGGDGAEGGDGDAGNTEGDFEPATAGDSAGDAGGMSGRKEWKMRHKKGSFNPKAAKKNEHRTPGSFIKSKKYK